MAAGASYYVSAASVPRCENESAGRLWASQGHRVSRVPFSDLPELTVRFTRKATPLLRSSEYAMGQEPTFPHLQISEACIDRSTHPHRVPAVGDNRLPGYAFHSAIADNHLGDVISAPGSSKD
jgi:hypothetical protein